MTSYLVVIDLSELLEFLPLMWGLIKKQYVDFHFLVVLHVALAQVAYSGASLALERLCIRILLTSGLTSVYSSHVVLAVASNLMFISSAYVVSDLFALFPVSQFLTPRSCSWAPLVLCSPPWRLCFLWGLGL